MSHLIIILFCTCLFILPIWALSHSQKPSLMLAKTQNLQDFKYSFSRYIVSEKLDGVRGYWNGKHLLTRSGIIINAPNWFIEPLPHFPLEGELWISRGQFDRISAIVRTQNPVDQDWQQVKFMLFDSPKRQLSFIERVDELKKIINKVDMPWIQVVQHHQFNDFEQLSRYFNQVINSGGEGIMLNSLNGHYQVGRASQLLKLKPYLDDEAIILEYRAGKGQFSQMMGAMLVKNKAGVTFKIGSGFTKQQRLSPPALGTIISYRYSGNTKNGLPRFPSFIKVRSDLDQL